MYELAFIPEFSTAGQYVITTLGQKQQLSITIGGTIPNLVGDFYKLNPLTLITNQTRVSGYWLPWLPLSYYGIGGNPRI